MGSDGIEGTNEGTEGATTKGLLAEPSPEPTYPSQKLTRESLLGPRSPSSIPRGPPGIEQMIGPSFN